MRVEFDTDRHDVIDYAVLLLVGEEGEEQTVRLYDGSHGVQRTPQVHQGWGQTTVRDLPPRYPWRRYAIRDQTDPDRLRGDDRVMAEDLRNLPARTPAERIALEAIELVIEGRSPYPDKAMFIDAEEPWAGAEIKRAVDKGKAVVLAYKDGGTRVLHAEMANR